MMHRFVCAVRSPVWWYVWALVLVAGFGLWMSTPSPQDDFGHYQRFIETLAQGHLDLSIPGFHGMNMLAVPWYLLSHSPIAAIDMQMAMGTLLPLLAFLAARSLFQSDWHGIVFATVIALMPALTFSALRGWMVATYNVLFFLTIIGAARKARWTWLPWGFAMISLPFAVALLPLLVFLTPRGGSVFWRYRQIFYALCIPAIYLAIQIYQTGQVQVGVHQGLTAGNVWQGPERIFLNIAHTLQIIFSVHNYYFVDPARTGQGNMMQTTPVLIFCGIHALLYPKTFFGGMALPMTLLLGAFIGIGLNVGLDHMDHFYMETGLFFLLIASIPFLRNFPLWIPFALATLHFQWFYFFLQYHNGFAFGPAFFAAPIFVDVMFVLWCVLHRKDVYGMLRLPWKA